MKYSKGFSILILLLAVQLTAQDLPEWQNPDIVQLNRVKPHATSFSFESEELAMKGDRILSENYLSLNGTWKFKCCRNYQLIPYQRTSLPD